MGYKKTMMKLFGAVSQNAGGGPSPHIPNTIPTASTSASPPSTCASSMAADKAAGLDPVFAVCWLQSMPSLSTFDAHSLQVATNNFSPANKLGEGGFGSVYKGRLQNGTPIAVKKLDRSGLQGDQEFITEVSTLNNLRHPNIVKLYGVCVEDRQRMCVYQLAQGSLRARLDSKAAKDYLSWKQRMRILRDVALGLFYLHEGTNPAVVHSDVTSNNVLLIEDGSACIADFGLAQDVPRGDKECVTLTEVRSAFGYIAPELAAKGILSRKADTFSFGVLLLEVLTGQQPVDTSRPKGQHELVDWLRPLLSDASSMQQVVDTRLGKAPALATLQRLCGVAEGCIRHDPEARLSMRDVAKGLSSIYMAVEHQQEPKPVADWPFEEPQGSARELTAQQARVDQMKIAPAEHSTVPVNDACLIKIQPPGLSQSAGKQKQPVDPFDPFGTFNNPFTTPFTGREASSSCPPPNLPSADHQQIRPATRPLQHPKAASQWQQETSSPLQPSAVPAESASTQDWWRSLPNPFLAAPQPSMDPFASAAESPSPSRLESQPLNPVPPTRAVLHPNRSEQQPVNSTRSSSTPSLKCQPNTSTTVSSWTQPGGPLESSGRQLDKLCLLCMDACRDHELSPCGHAAACMRCASVLVAVQGPCPVCSVSVTSVRPRQTAGYGKTVYQAPLRLSQQYPTEHHHSTDSRLQAAQSPHVSGVA